MTEDICGMVPSIAGTRIVYIGRRIMCRTSRFEFQKLILSSRSIMDICPLCSLASSVYVLSARLYRASISLEDYYELRFVMLLQKWR